MVSPSPSAEEIEPAARYRIVAYEDAFWVLARNEMRPEEIELLPSADLVQAELAKEWEVVGEVRAGD